MYNQSSISYDMPYTSQTTNRNTHLQARKDECSLITYLSFWPPCPSPTMMERKDHQLPGCHQQGRLIHDPSIILSAKILFSSSTLLICPREPTRKIVINLPRNGFIIMESSVAHTKKAS
jgi:hypothetical protein